MHGKAIDPSIRELVLHPIHNVLVGSFGDSFMDQRNTQVRSHVRHRLEVQDTSGDVFSFLERHS